jgi:hypothetical protein
VLVRRVGAVAVACAAVSGCTINIGSNAPPATAKVSKSDLQKDISARVAKAGRVPESVSCPDDLVGEVGKTMRCAVTMSPNSSFETLVTATSVEGTKVNYDVVPAVSKTQLEASVSQQVARSSQAPVDSVACESGLDGKVGAVAHCAVTAGGATLRRAVVVTGVAGFAVNYTVVPILTKEIAADSLQAQLGQIGPRPDSASCADNLDGITGTTVECTTVTGGRPQTYILTVTTVTGTNITYSYIPKP